MKQIRALIVEDSILMQRMLKEVLKTHFPEIAVIGTTGFVSLAIDQIQSNTPDLILMDIHLNDGTAFDILKNVDTSKFRVIFISAYHEYMLESLKFSSIDFVFKPFDMNEIIFTVERAIDGIKESKSELEPSNKILDTLIENVYAEENNKQLVMKGTDEMLVVPMRNVIWGKSNLGYSEFHFTNKPTFESSASLRHYEEFLQHRGFIRCHSHYLVNVLHIDFVDPVSELIHMINGDKIPVDPKKYDAVMELIQSQKVLK